MLKYLTCLFIFFLVSNSSVLSQNWTQIPSGTTKNLAAISFGSSNVGYIGGEDSLLLKTVDGGQTWAHLNYSGISFFPGGHSIVDLKFVSETVGYLTVGPYSGTYKTTDGGLTWSTFDPLYACYNTNMFFFDENNGFLGGSGCFSGEIINKLNNTWQETNVTPTYILQGGQITNFDFWNNNLGIASSSGQYFFKTSDGGNNWDTIPNSLTSLDSMTSVLFISADTILATYYSPSQGNFGVLISFNGGLTWQPEMNSATFFYPNMFASKKSGNGHIFIGGENYITTGGINPGIIYESNGSISNWSYETLAEGIRDIDSYGDSVVFAVGQNGYIVVNQNLAQMGTVSEKINLDFEIFPNPNNGEFIILLRNTKSEKIEIVDLQGRLVFTSSISPNQNVLNISKLKSGIYHVHLKSNTEFFVKKVIVQ